MEIEKKWGKKHLRENIFDFCKQYIKDVEHFSCLFKNKLNSEPF